ncbi:MAG: hypothetical protein M3Z25_04670 [Actinomycetota bacterium]|nr:hypothetical protein [Actinomycetota bacterium]
MPGRALLAELKADPGQVGLETLLREIDKLAAVRALGSAARVVLRREREAVRGVACPGCPVLSVGSAGGTTSGCG